MLRTETAEVVETIIPPTPEVTPPTPELRVHHEEDTFNHDVSAYGVASAPPPAIPGIIEESEYDSDEGHESGDDNRSYHGDIDDNRSKHDGSDDNRSSHESRDDNHSNHAGRDDNHSSHESSDDNRSNHDNNDFARRSDSYYTQDSRNEERHVTASTIEEQVDDTDDTSSNSSSEESGMYTINQPRREGTSVIHEQDEINVADSSAANDDYATRSSEARDSSISGVEAVVADPPPPYSHKTEVCLNTALGDFLSMFCVGRLLYSYGINVTLLELYFRCKLLTTVN